MSPSIRRSGGVMNVVATAAMSKNCLFLLFSLLLTLSSSNTFMVSAQDVGILPVETSLMDVIRSAREFAFMTILLEESGLVKDVDSANPGSEITIFAPVDTAFEDDTINEELLTMLLTDEQWFSHLRDLVEYHMAETEVQLVDGQEIATFNGESISVSVSDRATILDGVATIGDEYSVVNAGKIHALDKVLDPGWISKNSDDMLRDMGRFSTYLDIKSQLVLITVQRYLTVFAPSDAAFGASGLEVINNVDENFLLEIWSLHVVEGIYPSLTNVRELQSLSGKKLEVISDPLLGTVSVNGHRIVETYLTNDGVIHVVEGLLSEENTDVDVPDIPDVPNAPILDRDQMERCMYNKAVEEIAGELVGVQCSCDVIDDWFVSLSCTTTTQSGGELCIPKNGVCDEDAGMTCCSPFTRRCREGQCRDSRKPERTKVGGADGIGGAVRPRRDRNGSVRSESLP
ncbi:MAG: hypothetical protein SGILL_001288 [Bacillariaceae sp.]